MAIPGTQFVVIVTGANKGIGLECVRNLAKRVNDSFLFKKSGAESSVIYLASRDLERGQEAAKAIKPASGVEVSVAALDVNSTDSIKGFAEEIKSRHGKVHALINNAGVSVAVGGDGAKFDSPTLDRILETNYYGVKEMTNAFLPLMDDYGRISNVSSGMSSLASISSAELKNRLRGAREVKEVDDIVKEFRDATKAGTFQSLGWPPRAYSTSKMVLNALTRAFAAENKGSRPNLLINYIYPGWVKTDMGGWGAPGTAEQGADSPVWAVVDDIGGKSGVGFKDRAEVAW